MARRLAADPLGIFKLSGAVLAAKAPRLRGSLFGAVVALALAPGETNAPTWVQICSENTYKGHPAAKQLAWDRAFFEQVVANFRAHPWYKAGQNGVGSEPVVPFDFEHASELEPTSGSIPQAGAPAAGWVLELSIRDAEDGSAELWALSTFRDDVREQIRAGGYRSTSVAIAPNSVDPVSGAKLGPVLTSVALTNHPFVQGMEPIAATLEQFGPAETNEEALVGLRRIFELVSDADAALVVQQIQALRTAIAGGTVPESVDLKYLLESIRRLLSLGLMATTDEILGGAEAAANGSAPSNSGQASGQTENPSMAGLATALAAIFKCTEDDKAIITAASKASEKAAESAAAEQVTDALSKLKAMFGSSDMQDLIAKATKTIADAEALKPTLEALAAAQAALKGNAEQDAEAESAAVAASLARGDTKLAERLKPGILAARIACIGNDGVIDPKRLEKFRQDFPLEETQRALLSQRIVAGPNGQQLGGAVTGYRTEPITASSAGSGAQTAGIQKLVDEINSQPGRNAVERCDALLCTRSAAHKALPWGERCRLAGEFNRKVLAGELPALPA